MSDDDHEFRATVPEDGDLSDRPYAIYQCVDCENVVLSMQDCADGMTCHGEPMERVSEATMDVQAPALREVLLDAFGLPKAGLDICLCVIGEGPLSPAEVAAELDYDESTIRTYLTDLVEMGLLEKATLNRKGGGTVSVFHSVDLEEMRRESLIGFYVWAGEAAALLEEANLTKAEYVEDDHEDGLDAIFWEQIAERRSGDRSSPD